MIQSWIILKHILIKEICDNFVQQNATHKFFAILREDDLSSKLPTIYIPAQPTNTVLLKTDHETTKPVFFQSNCDLRRRSDYILLTKIDDINVVIHIELKSNLLKKSLIKRQMEGTNCLLQYIEAVSRRLLPTPITFFDPSKIEHRYVVIYVPDKPVKFFKENKIPRPRIGHNSPDHPFFYPVFTGGKHFPKTINYEDLIKL